MRRIRLIVQYDGTDYVGWQMQSNGVAIQEVVENEISKIIGVRPQLHASGRTDSRVHARAQVAHFDTDSRIPADKFAYALNTGLPRDIRIVYSDEARGDSAEGYGFHSRFDVIEKHYRYTVKCAPHADPFTRNTALHIHTPIDLEKMQFAAKDILGEHDFIAFKSQGTDLDSTVRTMYESKWTQDGAFLYYDVAGSGFMYNMVRILVGTMLEIGGGKRDENAMKRAIETGKRNEAGATAPAHGLMLYRVKYKDFDTEDYVL